MEDAAARKEDEVCYSETLCLTSAGYVSIPWNQSAQTVRIACPVYRSCRKATPWFEIPACNSASLPIVPQRASCIVDPLQY